MNKIKLILSFVITLHFCHDTMAQTCKEIIGYYPNWQWYDRAKLVRPNTIAYNKYNIINYCFFKPEANGTISNTDTWPDENLLQGQINWSTPIPTYYPNTSLIDLAHNAGVKVMVSIGGWTMSDNFPTIAASPTLRAKLAGECNRLIKFYNFDGIDIDWEYPGYAPQSGTAADKVNLTLFLRLSPRRVCSSYKNAAISSDVARILLRGEYSRLARGTWVLHTGLHLPQRRQSLIDSETLPMSLCSMISDSAPSSENDGV